MNSPQLLIATPTISSTSSSAPASPLLEVSTVVRRLFVVEPSDGAWMHDPAADMPSLHIRPRPNPASFTKEARQNMLTRRLGIQQPPNAPNPRRARKRVF